MDSAAWVIVFLGVYLLFICLLFYTLMFGGEPANQESIFGRANYCMTVTLTDALKRAVGAIFCRGDPDPFARAEQAFGNCGDFFERRVMPLIYVGLLASGLLAAKKLVIPRLNEITVVAGAGACPRTKLFCAFLPENVTRTTDPLLLLTMPPETHPNAVYFHGILAFGSWLAVYLADPGYVTQESITLLRNAYPCDGLLFQPGKMCKTCKLPKLPRSKHDRLIGGCVLRYDHYCGWTGNVIGLYNTNRFLFFLITHLTMLIHGALLCAELVYARILLFIDGRYTYTPTNTIITRFQPMVAFTAEPTLCLFLFVMLVSILVVGGFLIYHVSLITRNITTSESFKWSPINEACRDYMAANNGRSYGRKIRAEARAEATAKGTEFDESSIPLFGPDGMPINIYDNGVFGNALEVMYPRRFARLARAAAVEADRGKTE
jgi:hypothetical protein